MKISTTIICLYIIFNVNCSDITSTLHSENTDKIFCDYKNGYGDWKNKRDSTHYIFNPSEYNIIVDGTAIEYGYWYSKDYILTLVSLQPVLDTTIYKWYIDGEFIIIHNNIITDSLIFGGDNESY